MVPLSNSSRASTGEHALKEAAAIVGGVVALAAGVFSIATAPGAGWLVGVAVVAAAALLASVVLMTRSPVDHHKKFALVAIAVSGAALLVSFAGLAGVHVEFGASSAPSATGSSAATTSMASPANEAPSVSSTSAKPLSGSSAVKTGVSSQAQTIGEPVAIVVSHPTPTAVHVEWRVSADAPGGQVRFLAALLRDVDPNNQHDDYYIKRELGRAGSAGFLDFDMSQSAVGSRRTILAIAVNASCAADLRIAQAKDEPRSKQPCAIGSYSVDSNQVDIVRN